MTPEQIDIALLAAGNLRGFTSEQIAAKASGTVRARILAAAALHRLGLAPQRKLAASLSLSDYGLLAPSALRKNGITEEEVAAVAAAVADGAIPSSRPKRRAAAQTGAVPAASVWQPPVTAALVEMFHAGRTQPQMVEALTERFGGPFTVKAVGKKLARLGLKLTPEQVNAHKALRPKTPKPERTFRVFNPSFAKPLEPPKTMAANDRELIARFLAERGATPCPYRAAYGAQAVEYVGGSWRAA